MSLFAGHDERAGVVAFRCVAFDGENVEARFAYVPTEVCRPQDACIRRLADCAHHGQGQSGQPDEWVHIADAGSLGDEQAPCRKQSVDATQRARQVADQMEIVESQDRVERRRTGRERFCVVARKARAGMR